MTSQEPSKRSYHLSLDRFLLGLLGAQVFLLLSERFRWFFFNENHGWTVLIANGVTALAVLTILLWFPAAVLRGHRPWFSVRSALLSVAVISIPLAWLSSEVLRARRQRAIVEVLTRADRVAVSYDYEVDARGVRGDGESVTPIWLRKWLGEDFFRYVRVITSKREPVTDADLEQVGRLTKLEWLNIEGPGVTDAGLEHVRGLTDLTHLSLRMTQVTDDGLEDLKRLGRLRDLYLSRTNVTDDGLEHLEGLRSLEKIYLNETQITDKGLRHLKALANLRVLYLNETQVTDDGLEHLKELTSLHWLMLDRTRVTDSGLEHLAGLTHLERLSLRGTQVTDAGLEHLTGLVSLRKLTLERTKVTGKAIRQRLKPELPDCDIQWY